MSIPHYIFHIIFILHMILNPPQHVQKGFLMLVSILQSLNTSVSLQIILAQSLHCNPIPHFLASENLPLTMRQAFLSSSLTHPV